MSSSPEVLTDAHSARTWTRERRLAGSTVALVPTMGALHEGHLELVRVAHEHADAVVVSIFVNPLQFDRSEDLARYPRTLEADVERCAAMGVDAVYTPTAATMYPEGFDTSVEPGYLARPLEGAHRPGHFSGVATVVTKLFASVEPDVAVFGRKDAQQLAIVQRMARDLDLGVRVVAVPTVREPDGLAMSSRNVRLGPLARRTAARIPWALAAARAAVTAGETSARTVEALVADHLEARPRRDDLEIRLEYAEVVDPSTFTPLDQIVDGALLVVAAWVGGVRLIDNAPLVGDDALDALGYLDAHDDSRG